MLILVPKMDFVLSDGRQALCVQFCFFSCLSRIYNLLLFNQFVNTLQCTLEDVSFIQFIFTLTGPVSSTAIGHKSEFTYDFI